MLKKMLAVSVLFMLPVAAQAQQGGQGITDTEIVLGTHTDMSGPAATYGLAATNGIQMRIDEINEKGGINGRKLRLVAEDTQYQVPRAVQAGNKLINRDNVFAIIAGLGTPMVNAVFPMQEKAGVPNLFPNSQARVMWSPVNRLKFQFNGDYQDQAAAAVKYFLGKGKKTFCAEYQDTDFGKDIVEGAEAPLKAAGIAMAQKETHKPTDTDLGTQILNLRKAGCEVVVLGALGRDAIIAYTTARRLGWSEVEFVGVSPTFDPTVAASSGGGTNGLYSATPTYIPPRDQMTAGMKTWFDKYKAKYNVEVTPAAMNGYTGMDLTAIALEKAGKNVTLDGFIKGMESIKDYHDAFGSPAQNYSSEKHQGLNAVYVTRIKDGGFELIAGPITPN